MFHILKCDFDVYKGVVEEIARGANRASLGDAPGGTGVTKSEYLKINGKRLRNIVYDNFIGTILSNSVEKKDNIEFALFSIILFKWTISRYIAVIKSSDGEISQANLSKGKLLRMSILPLMSFGCTTLFSNFIFLILSIICFANAAKAPILVLLGLFFLLPIICSISVFVIIYMNLNNLIKQFGLARKSLGQETSII